MGENRKFELTKHKRKHHQKTKLQELFVFSFSLPKKEFIYKLQQYHWLFIKQVCIKQTIYQTSHSKIVKHYDLSEVFFHHQTFCLFCSGYSLHTVSQTSLDFCFFVFFHTMNLNLSWPYMCHTSLHAPNIILPCHVHSIIY